MALATYSDLTTSVASWLHRGGDTGLTSTVPDFISLAESKIYNRLRIRQMETSVASTIASGVIAVPTNYVVLKDAYISNTSPYQDLTRVTPSFIYERYPSRVATKTPSFIAREGSNFIFGPYPDSNYVVTLDFYNRLPALSSAVNSVFTSYPGLWLYGSLLEASPYLKDDKRIAVWQAKYAEIMNFVQDESDDEMTSGGNLTVMSDGITP